ncbi:MAG: 2'-5' RNA ligase family protein [Pedobacter sp.]|uniref:2'-5' RNA ligase family protein n=1 Tax=Pedobacter sp. TaxID=1411316 RepID=UPI003397C29C
MEKEQHEDRYPLILTLRLDQDSQAFFDQQRKLYFPAERNYLEAHLTLFHQLPDGHEKVDFMKNLAVPEFELKVTGLRNLGAGVAYRIESPELLALRKTIAAEFSGQLIPQDRQGYRPHITIMNKTTPQEALALLADLAADFGEFTIKATGLDLWSYLGGPWRHENTFYFKAAE